MNFEGFQALGLNLLKIRCCYVRISLLLSCPYKTSVVGGGFFKCGCQTFCCKNLNIFRR